MSGTTYNPINPEWTVGSGDIGSDWLIGYTTTQNPSPGAFVAWVYGSPSNILSIGTAAEDLPVDTNNYTNPPGVTAPPIESSGTLTGQLSDLRYMSVTGGPWYLSGTGSGIYVDYQGSSDDLIVTGYLQVENDATISSASSIDIESGGTLLVTDPGSLVRFGATLSVGESHGAGFMAISHQANASGLDIDVTGTSVPGTAPGAAGVLDITADGTLVTTGTLDTIGLTAGGTGTVTVDGVGSKWTSAGQIGVGFIGNGTLIVSDRATVTAAGEIDAGQSPGATGTLLIESGGTVKSGGTLDTIGGTGGNGTVTVTGTLSTWTAGALLAVGNGGTGDININQGAVVTASAGLAVGNQSTGSGLISVTGGGTLINNGTNLLVATAAGSSGTVMVGGNGSLLQSLDDTNGVAIGQAGSGTLDIETGGTVEVNGSNGIGVGKSAGATGLIIVNGAGALLLEGEQTNGMGIGQAGSGTLLVEGGGTVALYGTSSSSAIGLGQQTGSSGLVIVSGPGSLLDMETPDSGPNIGKLGNGTLDVLSGGTVIVDDPVGGGIGVASSAGAYGTVLVSGFGSVLQATGTIPGTGMTVGNAGTAALTVDQAGALTIGAGLRIGGSASGTGSVLVDAGFLSAGWLTVGSGGAGTLTITDGSQALVSGFQASNIGGAVTGSGTLVVNAGTVTDAQGAFNVGVNGQGYLQLSAGGILSAPTIAVGPKGTVGLSNGTLIAAAETLSFGAAITGNGTLAGTLTNNGVIFATGGSMVLSGPIAGTGTIVISNHGEALIEGPVAAGQTIAFADSTGTLDVTNPSGFAGTIVGYQPGDTIIPTLCFLKGTLIDTAQGPRPVEQLRVGDIVPTLNAGDQPIAWIGTGQVLATRGRRSAATPVIVRKSAFADNVPNRDLHVTKGHAFHFDGALIPIEFLVNHRSILWDDRAQEVRLYHIELATHDVLLANGAEAESYRDDGNRWLFQNANAGWHLPPKPPCFPVVTGGDLVDTVWRHLLERSGWRPGLPLTNDPDLHLMVDGVRVDPCNQQNERVVFRLTQRPDSLRIRSRAAVPQEIGLARDDRLLGVALRQIVLAESGRQRLIEVSDSALTDGYHPYEPNGALRWTDGDGVVPASAFSDLRRPFMLILYLAGTTRYLDDGISEMAA